MDVFELRDRLLKRDIEMSRGLVPADPRLQTLIAFENWCANGGLAGFAQVADRHDLSVIADFARANDLPVVIKMIDLLRSGSSADLGRYDTAFFEVMDDYTTALHADQFP